MAANSDSWEYRRKDKNIYWRNIKAELGYVFPRILGLGHSCCPDCYK